MRYYRERPNNLKNDYSVFLIQNPDALTEAVLTKITNKLIDQGSIVSFEKLARSDRQALVVYGPKQVLKELDPELNLIELEDYSKKLTHFVSCWEIGEKRTGDKSYREVNLSLIEVNLADQEQLWWQIIVSPGGTNLRSSMRILIESPNSQHLNNLNHQVLSRLETIGLSFLPQVYSIHRLIKFYRERALGGGVFQQNNYIIQLDIKALANIVKS